MRVCTCNPGETQEAPGDTRGGRQRPQATQEASNDANARFRRKLYQNNFVFLLKVAQLTVWLRRDEPTLTKQMASNIGEGVPRTGRRTLRRPLSK